jgi:CheY-like chemotaxis protein
MDSPVRVLLVDESDDVLDLTRQFLGQESDAFEVETATSAADAVAAVDAKPFDAVVGDYHMPDIEGPALAQRLRERNPGLPFVLFTGRDRAAVETDLQEADLDGHVQKRAGTDQYAELAAAVRDAVEARSE